MTLNADLIWMIVSFVLTLLVFSYLFGDNPAFRIATAILRTLLGEQVPERVVAQSLFSLFGQCVIYMTGRPMIERLTPDIRLDEPGLQQIADHISEFSWAGIQALRQRYQGESR